MGKDIDITEIQKDISDYVSKKYGIKFKVAGIGSMPEPAKDKTGEEEQEAHATVSAIHFDMKPDELKTYLDEYMVKQDDAKEVLSTKICTHFNRIKRFELNRKKKRPEMIGEIKNNIIMIGPTGVGKTFLVKLIANKIGVPFVKGDATKFSETGYVGGDVEDLVRDLVSEAKGDIELAQYGIIYLDEIDKIAASRSLIGPDVSRTGVQRALLKPLEETEVELKVPHDPISQMEAMQEYQRTGKREKKKISTRHILFIMSGAFNGLEDIVQKRRNRKGIGFGSNMPSKDASAENLKHLKAEDLIQYGFESEFIGRLPVVTIFEHLEVEDLYKILRNPKSPIIVGKKRDFKSYGIDLQFEDEALHRIAENAFRERTGARGLVSSVERVLMKFEHTLPSTDIRQLLVTPKMVDDPAAELEAILACPDDAEREAAFKKVMCCDEERLAGAIAEKIPEWKKSYGLNLPDTRIKLIIRHALEQQTDLEQAIEDIQANHQVLHEFTKQFSERNDLDLSFTDEAVDSLTEKVWKEPQEPLDYLKRSLNNYDHGLKLVKEKTGRRQFIITGEGIERPEQFLNSLIQEAYRNKCE
ncbi:MAG: ATP-dependent Clp protease ATP-binding subunit ClpX [Syntrophus sp. SKADARSKE-3]|nr:ATP-dependent Clp protease ATP-binding subunit ClpX [Syntrophus sp. SKADARSKE-3]